MSLINDGDYPPKTPLREIETDANDLLDTPIESSPIKIESITKYNKPSEVYVLFRRLIRFRIINVVVNICIL